MTRDDLKKSEEEKRERCWNARERWRVLQETIAWVDLQQPVPRNSRQGCLAKQAQLLAGMNAQVFKDAT